MKRIVFVAHDPGSCDALYPVYEKLRNQAVFLAVGPSASKRPEYFAENWESTLQNIADKGELVGVVMGRDWGTDIDVRLIVWARKRHIKTMVILDYWSNYAASFWDKGMVWWPDAYLVMDELARREAAAEGVPNDILRIVGHPGLDKFCKRRGGDKTPERDVLFLSQPLSALYGDSLGYTEHGVLDDVRKACQSCGRTLDVKFHPKDEPNFQYQYRDISISGDTDELMNHYKVVIGMSSMALLHGALMRVPIISYQPNLTGQDGCITNRLGLSRCLKSYEALVEVLSGAVVWQPMAVDETKSLLWLDGKSTQRAANAVLETIDDGAVCEVG